MLLVAVLLCGCGADAGEDGIVMELSEQKEPDSSLMDTNMTDVSQNVTTMSENAQMLYVHVCGAVAAPGVYRMEPGSRRYEAIEKAGGLTDEADETCLNMAEQISDGEQIRVLTRDEMMTMSRTSGLVNINTATVSELTTVSGIGESRAQAIISYRETNGSFGCIEDIKKVDGIKDGLYAKIKDKITV